MISKNDFEMKQTIFVFTRNGDKISFSNDNLIVKDNTDKIRFQVTCYRIFALFIIGDITLTSGIISRSHKFGFPIVMMTTSLKVYDVIGHKTEGNYILRKLQYDYNDLDLAKHVIVNKICNQKDTLALQIAKDNQLRADMSLLNTYAEKATSCTGDFRELMGIEGNASKIFFRSNFNSIQWVGRKPRVKCDIVNSTLDIGYTLIQFCGFNA